jgi:hypothetical protein
VVEEALGGCCDPTAIGGRAKENFEWEKNLSSWFLINSEWTIDSRDNFTTNSSDWFLISLLCGSNSRLCSLLESLERFDWNLETIFMVNSQDLSYNIPIVCFEQLLCSSSMFYYNSLDAWPSLMLAYPYERVSIGTSHLIEWDVIWECYVHWLEY